MSSHAVNLYCDDTLSIKKELRNALEAAHKALKNERGTTTLLGGILLKVRVPSYSSILIVLVQGRSRMGICIDLSRRL